MQSIIIVIAFAWAVMLTLGLANNKIANKPWYVSIFIALTFFLCLGKFLIMKG